MPDFGIFRGFNDKLFGNKLYAGQLPTQLGTIGSVVFGDPDAQAFLNRVISAGGSLSANEQNAINQLVLDLKTYSIWSKMKAIYPMVGASAAACAQNLKSSSFTGTFSSGWTFANTGATPNGTSAYMDTTLIPNTSLTTSSGHFSFYSRSNVANSSEYEMGTTNNVSSGPWNALIVKFSNGLFYSAYGQYNATFANLDSRGFYIVNRNSITNTTGFKNNTKVINTIQTAGLSTRPMYIGAENANGTAASFSTKQCAFASIGDGLTDTEASNFYTAVQAFQTTLSRQV